ncbi:hypothetical protein CTI12_AA110340 [Artemisia annua]|uniref:Uncharacterized protein n=1 Tax=Artemisia annua TaxID=35608 RepID=A0A2U1PV37_ARTAN|nr:hypothetical protein CTI12_AA110340 [Artemisia annua]
MTYVRKLGVLCDFSAFGSTFNFPANYPANYENKEKMRYKYIPTKDSKASRLENNVISGIGRFIIQCSDKKKIIILITSNIRMATPIMSYSDLGYKIVLVTTQEGQRLRETVRDKVLGCEDWKDLPE